MVKAAVKKYRILALLLIALLLVKAVGIAQPRINTAWCEGKVSPVGVAADRPKFSWEISSPVFNTSQTAYEIRVSKDPSRLVAGKKLVWSSGKVESQQSVHVPYGGPALQSGETYFWQVRIWDNHGKRSSWSPVASWQMALLRNEDWKAKWIEAGFEEDTVNRPVQYFRKDFAINRKIISAVLFITAHGMYEAFVNGKRVGNDYFTPGWTSYAHRLQYQQYDVTKFLQNGVNAIGASVANGWYRGYLAWENNKNVFGNKLGLLAQIQVNYADGTREWIATDESWSSGTGAIRYSELYHGETIDANQEQAGWNQPGFQGRDWVKARLGSHTLTNLVPTFNEAIRQQEVIKPIKLIQTPKGEVVLDFGQNLVGWVRIKANGRKGDTIKVYHAEVLDRNGNFYTTNLRLAKARMQYVLQGKEEELLQPHFTFFGFRYIKLEGIREAIDTSDFEAIVLHSDMAKTGEFQSGLPLINQLQHNIQWGQKGNFLDVPTDCPQRDERLGWTGDAQVFFRTAAFNRNVYSFFAKWMDDLAADQLKDGSIPYVVPNALGTGFAGSAGWGDAATIIPWNLYQVYGDKQLLQKQYPMMKKWVEFIRSKSKDDLWNSGFHFGDWLFYRPDDDNDGRAALTDKYLIAQCFYAHSTQLLINAANVLGLSEDARQYSALLEKVKAAFNKEYVTASGRLVSSSQTAYVLALEFDMLPEHLRMQAADRLEENIKSYSTHITTGFLGTPYICKVLTRFGKTDLAYQLLLREKYPSWLYPVTQGATTIWERWDGQKPDGSFQTESMNSFNHYAYGAIGDWMYRFSTGIDTDPNAPGYKRAIIAPFPDKRLKKANASLHTFYGRIVSSWEMDEKGFKWIVEVPCNSSAKLIMPFGKAGNIMINGVSLAGFPGKLSLEEVSGKPCVELGSGSYTITVSSAEM
ncbi:glycoside hydrolase family 78 protein [Flavihumibacter rivuli]|uniref:alpha-L-rhamnosidase n=1 Tax=Flavihumibacter rivuli TaxID=2838156 RepID=UPI001BDE9851|nr:alpha-L-rhamnosidase [Flavihumibacter rivuli]ULQ55332.1 glycoside hydrolase family 78 protein [Flavihumibacter rivuli]